MNNGKVRIYDLSRELNLDNKDILAICDQLRIPVKSHSSTITDESAERIRTVAEKYAAQHTSPSKSAPSHNKTHSQSPPSGPKPNAPKKQQILGIRQHQERPAVNPPKQLGAPVAIPPQPPVSQPTSLSMKPSAPTRPVRPSQNQEVVANDKGTPLKVQQIQQVQQVPPSRPAPEQPKLTEPPSRPVASPPNRQANQNQTDQPVKKKPKPAATGQQPVEKKAEGREDKREDKRQEKREDRKQSLQESKPNRTTAPPAPPLPELQRPKPVVKPNPPSRPIRPAASEEADLRGDTAAEGEEIEETTALSEQDLKRPQPPRPPKKAKNWEEEEEDLPSKAAKVKGAGKRSKQALFDEDEVDFDESDLEVLPPTIQVSLSVARPPKPKAPRSAPATAAAQAATKRQKEAPSRDGNAAKAARNRGREESAVDRPQKLVLIGSMTVQELAQALGVPDTEIVKRLFFKGMAVTITQSLDVPTVTMLANDLGVEVETAQKEAEASKGSEMIDVEDLDHLQRRPPVVTIMGHVDHGKTTLLDAIRESKVAQGEAGGITQHIGAYHVDVQHEGNTQQVVFLDTPGHEAFTAMRARGARVTDIAVLVVAADDGVQPQTIEAISHAKAAEVPIVVAINKIDKPDAQPDRVKQELTEFALVPEEWGGETIMVSVSAMQKQNLDSLLEMILLVAEVDEHLVANPNRSAKGTVIEANLDKSRGPVATLLVQNGTLRVGDILVAGSAFGKVRAMIDDRGNRVDAASPSFAVEVLGLSEVPAAGDEFDVFQDEKKARALAQERAEQQRQSRLMRGVTLTTLSAKAQEGELKELNLILKADVQGSAEAIVSSLQQLPQNQVQIRILLAAPGEITQTDVDLAAASNAVIVGFNTTLASGARQAADQAGVDVREYNIIYKLLEDIQGAMEGLLEPELVEEALGEAEVRAVFPVGRGAVAGCYIMSGKAVRNCKVRVRRGGQVIYEGTLDSLKRMKEDAKEVNAGFECGIGIDKFNDWSVGDRIEAFKMVTKRRTLTPS
ncbi:MULTISPECIES: translation initiation factor IF-2 [Aerosakkonema]|uniref:translation initiation factor IF-2 n=1 Tax=Aerosakkonema TaxID=1246629 RepID=UPI0035BAE293